ncbi:unnamed protein product, partial [Prorocentrum cordatum]
AIKTLEGLVKLQTEEYVAMQGQLRDKNAALSHTTGQLAVQEQQHRDATAELHEVVRPHSTAVLNLADSISGDPSKLELTCGEDLFGLAEFVDVTGDGKRQAKARETELEAWFQETAMALFGELKAKAEQAKRDEDELRERLKAKRRPRQICADALGQQSAPSSETLRDGEAEPEALAGAAPSEVRPGFARHQLLQWCAQEDAKDDGREHYPGARNLDWSRLIGGDVVGGAQVLELFKCQPMQKQQPRIDSRMWRLDIPAGDLGDDGGEQTAQAWKRAVEDLERVSRPLMEAGSVADDAAQRLKSAREAIVSSKAEAPGGGWSSTGAAFDAAAAPPAAGAAQL